MGFFEWVFFVKGFGWEAFFSFKCNASWEKVRRSGGKGVEAGTSLLLSRECNSRRGGVYI